MQSDTGGSDPAPSLGELYAAHGGKVSDKWTRYLGEYERLFAPYRSRALSLLEIGVQNGGSLELWSRYFPAATRIVGCDIDPRCGQLHYEDPRIRVVVADASGAAAPEAVRALVPAPDVVIDDGSHKSGDIIRAFANYFPLLEDGGLYVCEDLCVSYWKEFDGGLANAHSSLSFFKRLVDVVNHEHWRIPGTRRDVLGEFSARYRTCFDEQQLARIHSVEFINSMCVLRKEPAADNVLGSRVVVGEIAAVEPAPRAMHDSSVSTVAGTGG